MTPQSESPSRGSRPPRGGARSALLDAAVDVVRAQGLHATSVDELCEVAGVTKGAFFHHFTSKEELAVAVAEHWSETTGQLFASAPYHDHAKPADRVFGYLDFRESLVTGGPAEFSCVVGTMSQEAFDTHPAVRDACAASIFGHARTLEADIVAALAATGEPDAEARAASLARHTQAVLQGAFVLAKAGNDPAQVVEAIGHLRRYFGCIIGGEPSAPATRDAATP